MLVNLLYTRSIIITKLQYLYAYMILLLNGVLWSISYINSRKVKVKPETVLLFLGTLKHRVSGPAQCL